VAYGDTAFEGGIRTLKTGSGILKGSGLDAALPTGTGRRRRVDVEEHRERTNPISDSAQVHQGVVRHFKSDNLYIKLCDSALWFFKGVAVEL
jgi:hypothetical protein